MKHRIVPILFLCLLLIVATAAWLTFTGPAPIRVAPAPTPDAIGRAFGEMAADPELAGAALAFCVLDGEGRPIFASPLAETAMTPASALKTLTTGAALEILGPDFRFETRLIATAAPDANGILKGDLVLVGSGDPTFTTEDLERLVAAAGLKRIEGRVRVDASVFPNDPLSDHWNWGDIGNAYGVGAFGLNLDHNRMLVRFDPGESIESPAALAGATNALSDIQWINHVVTGPAGSGDQVVVYSEPYGRRITLRGTVPAGEPAFEVRAANPDPPALAREKLLASLLRRGIVLAEMDVESSGMPVVLAVHRSAEIAAFIPHLHRVSDNLEAQCLFLEIGRKLERDPALSIREHWEKAGVDFTGLRLIDGSGLARANMIRPLDLAAVMHAAGKIDNFRESLSIYQPDGIRAKRGGMSGVRTEAGFIPMPDGSWRAFALMVNGLGSGVDFSRHRTALLEAARVAR